ncbi:YdcF family protein [Phenylobacterium sp.]|uniref:YdcF family protein n=1 Tax=Phenylobacterium sp. TaxID=1871053 RepID=UPI002F3F32BB
MRSAAILLLVVVLWAVGLWAFSVRVDQSTPPADPAPADAVVALTGSSNARITAAMKLLEDGKATRMLVSGVNPQASRADIKGVAKATRRYYDCCVDLGFQATDTVGNARETQGWMRSKGFRSLIVVTSDFHMPRAMLELHEALPDAKLTPYPVKTEDLDSGHWWRSGDGARRMIVEYCKYLVILAREAFLSLGPKAHPARAGPASPSGNASARLGSTAFVMARLVRATHDRRRTSVFMAPPLPRGMTDFSAVRPA